MFEATTRLREKMPPNFLDMSAPALPISRRRGRLAARLVALLSAGALVSTNLPAQAQKGPPIIRDAEIEQLLKEYTQPILRVAGLSRVRWRLAAEFTVNGALHAEAEQEGLFMRLSTRRPIAIPEPIRRRYTG